jgi:HK97 family phage prohead protease
MEYKRTEMLASVKDIDGRTVIGIPSVFGNIDDGNDIVHKGAFKKTIREQKERVRHLWQHDFWSPPIAKISGLQEVGKDALPKHLQKRDDVTGGLEVMRTYLTNERAQEVFEGIQTGALNEMSFAFDPKKYDYSEVELAEERSITVRNLRELHLWETSDVIWGMNSLTSASKNWLPAVKTGHTSKKEAWEEPTLEDFTDQKWDDLPRQEKDRIAQHFAWTDTLPVQKFEDLRYAHHKASKQGVGPIVYTGVLSALKRFATDVTGVLEADFAKVYDHLAKHLGEYQEKALPLEVVVLYQVTDRILKEGLIPEGDLLGLLHEAGDMTLQFIESAEQPKADRALTDSLHKRIKRYNAMNQLFKRQGVYDG